MHLVEDPKWELAILATVQGFYEKLLQVPIGGEVPVPGGLEAVSLQQAEGDVNLTLASLRRWLRLLDMATTPAMLRQALTVETDPEIAEAMLRYFVRKKDFSSVNRDKTDLVATFLYRHPRVAGQWERRGYGLDGSLPLSPFEIALIEILADSDVPLLPEEHVQILRRFDPLKEEAQNFRSLNALLDSEIILRVRELKESLDSSFYHPGVLATLAPYNTVFGKKFDELFYAATKEIKNFADTLEEQGGSILGTVDGVEVTVEHIAGLEVSELLKMDYGSALEKFRRVSKLKQTLERDPPFRRIKQPIPFPGAKASAAASASSRGSRLLDVQAMRAAVTPQQMAAEETKLCKVEESIRVFVRVADPKFRQVVPMRFFNLTLTPAEAEACCAGYLEEKTLGAEVARVLLRIVAVIARMTTELEELRRAENSPSLWRLHADLLVALLEVARALAANASRIMAQAREEDEAPQAEAVQVSLQKLRDRCDAITAILGRKDAEPQVVDSP